MIQVRPPSRRSLVHLGMSVTSTRLRPNDDPDMLMHNDSPPNHLKDDINHNVIVMANTFCGVCVEDGCRHLS